MSANFLLLNLRGKSYSPTNKRRKILVQVAFIKRVEDIGRKERDGSRLIYKDGGEITTYDVEESVEQLAAMVHAVSALTIDTK
jgi:hypothetical protein